MSSAPDRTISHYRLLDRLGKGGMGDVFAAIDETLKRKVALKSIRAEHRFDAESKARFLREARLLSQLDHPNVCRVYDYIEEGGTGWLVLELIEGQTLRELIASGAETSRKLRIAEQIAAVLVATHATGVVHRDLKPGNVMITPAGEVKVLDFGLAQRVASLDAAPAGADAAADDRAPLAGDLEVTRSAHGSGPGTDESVFRTRLGAVSGTLAYMSPEQAGGSSATTASDMYSFGLLLQELFTGNPPYQTGLDAVELLRRVRAADTPAPQGLSRDLTTLIDRLKAKAPSQRPTAVDALERLQWVRQKPRRRLQQLAVAALVVIAAGGVAKYTFDLARERAAAVAARGEADQRRKQAETLIGFMLGNLRPKLEQVGRLDLLEDVGREATAYFKAVPAEALSNEELYRRSQAIYQIGLVHQQRGNLALAVESFRQSLALIGEVAGRAPENTEWQLGLGTSHFYLGDALRRQGDLDGALENYHRYWQIAERLLARDPTNATWQLEVAYGHSNVAGILESKGDLPGARRELETTLALKQQVSGADPQNVEWRRSLAGTHNRLGVVLQKLGELVSAKEQQSRNLAILQELLTRSPDDAPLQYAVSIAHGWLGSVHEDLGDERAAIAQHEARFAITSALVRRDPANADWQREHATTRVRLGEADLRRGAVAAAEAKYRESIATLAGLVEKSRTNVGRQRDLAVARARLSRLLLTARRPADAAEQARACLTLLQESRAGADGLRYSVDCELLLGTALAAGGRQADARASWSRALAAIEPPARKSSDPAYLQLWARALRHNGRAAEAADVAAKLAARGYRHFSFIEEFVATAAPERPRTTS